MTDPDYTVYSDYVGQICNQCMDRTTFKSEPIFQKVVENVRVEDGIKYFNLIQTLGFSVREIMIFTDLNDMYGAPPRYHIGPLYCSPTSLRYIYQAILILQTIKDQPDYATNDTNLKHIKLIEIGGAYGGLYLALRTYSYKFNIVIDEYTSFELDNLNKLQTNYLNEFRINTTCVSASDLVSFSTSTIVSPKTFIISNYSYSSFDQKTREEYRSLLLLNIFHGFIIWDNSNEVELDQTYTVLDKSPDDPDQSSKYVVF